MNFIFYLIIIFLVDLILKSVRDKRKIEEARRKRREELAKDLPSNLDDLRDKGESFLEERDRTFPDREDRSDKNIVDYGKSPSEEFSSQYEEYKAEERLERHRDRHSPKDKKRKDKENIDKERKNKSQIKKELLKGFIYSEILSEPKSRGNSRRGM